MQQRRALILLSPYQIRLSEERLAPLKSNEVLIRSLLSTFKHGTEMAAYHGSSSFVSKILDPQWRVFRDNPESNFYPRPLGNMTVGIVEQVGSEVVSLSVGDRVFGWLPIADWHISTENRLQTLGTLTPEQALVIDPANFALGGILDGEIRYRDQVLITGLGAIGLLAVQYCKLYGAKVYATSSFPLRLQLAKRYGADKVLNRNQLQDLGLEVKQMTGGGVDVVLECSGNYSQLHQAIRATRQCGRVVCIGVYSGEATSLNLGEEFLHNRISLLASLPAFSWNNPVRGEKPLYAKEIQNLVIEDLKANRLQIDDLLQPTYPFEEVEKAVEAISTSPQEVIKIMIRY